MQKHIDHTGHRFHRLLVISRAENDHYGTNWNCLCDCGKSCKVRGVNLRNDAVKSCGCTVREASSERATTHGMSNTVEWQAWNSMRRRCEKPTHKMYHRYGGRGITVCERWLTFEGFYADMGKRPSKKHSLERIDNDGNYEPANVKWATQVEQQNNKSTSLNLTWQGRTQTLTEWSRELGIVENTLRARLRKGWTVEEFFLRSVIKRAPAGSHPKYNPKRGRKFRQASGAAT